MNTKTDEAPMPLDPLEKIETSLKTNYEAIAVEIWEMNIKKLRKRLKLSTRELAKKCGVSHRTVEDWEQGRYEPKKPVKIILQTLIKNRKS